GIQPDLMVGTSIGAVNATYLAIQGINLAGVSELEAAWLDAKEADLLPPNYLRLALRSFLNPSFDSIYNRNREFYIAHGLSPDLKFEEIQEVELVLVATDLNSGDPVLFGTDKGQIVLDGLMASITLPPWMPPRENDGSLLMDGGVVSNLPVEPALRFGATDIIALDLIDFRETHAQGLGLGQLLSKLLVTVSKRQVEMELSLAESKRVPVRQVNLLGKEPIELWDFQHTEELIDQGYQITLKEIAAWEEKRKPFWLEWINSLRK
ncbi:MAG: patatin-like phospholipase family protein, partial [Anaerolineales bacterium]